MWRFSLIISMFIDCHCLSLKRLLFSQCEILHRNRPQAYLPTDIFYYSLLFPRRLYHTSVISIYISAICWEQNRWPHCDVSYLIDYFMSPDPAGLISTAKTVVRQYTTCSVNNRLSTYDIPHLCRYRTSPLSAIMGSVF